MLPQRADTRSSWRSPSQAWLWRAYGLMAVLLLGYLVWLVVRHNSGQFSVPLDGWFIDGIELVGSALCFVRGFQCPRVRPVAFALGSAVLTWSIGDIANTVESFGGRTPSVPSVADAFYLGFYPLAYAGVLLYMRREARGRAVWTWLDGVVAGLGAATVCAMFAFPSLVHSAGGGSLRVAIDLAYPIGDLVLLSFVAGGTVVLSGARKAPWVLLATGLAFNVLGDTFNLFSSSVGSSRVGTVMNGIAWPISIVLISVSVWLEQKPSGLLQEEGTTGFTLPGLGAAAAFVVLLVATFRHPGPVAVALATSTLAVAGVRLAFTAHGLRRLTEERHRLSITDDLTSLGNRRYLSRLLEAFFSNRAEVPEGESRPLAFLFIDLNHFKEINDTFGHPAGDTLLRQLGERFRSVLEPTDALVRLGGDEFAAVLMDAGPEKAADVAERLAGCLEEPFSLDAINARIGVSIGVALVPDDATDSTNLVWCADVAMYRAKLSGLRFAFFDQKLDDGSSRLSLAEDLSRALDHGEFVLHYQPQLDLTTGEILAVEALLRWSHPKMGLLPPVKFIPLAEEAGLMGRLTSWVLSEALAQCAEWREARPDMVVAVNVSPTNLLDPGFVDLVKSLLDRGGLPPESLVLEITETTIFADFETCKRVITELRDLGLVVSVDDFGAGFTSLAHLSSLAIRELKLDRSFIAGMTASEGGRDLQLVRATIELAHSMGLRVVAEGIEDAGTLELLSTIGCDVAQGYFISVPKPAHQLMFREQELAEAAALAGG